MLLFEIGGIRDTLRTFIWVQSIQGELSGLPCHIAVSGIRDMIITDMSFYILLESDFYIKMVINTVHH